MVPQDPQAHLVLMAKMGIKVIKVNEVLKEMQVNQGHLDLLDPLDNEDLQVILAKKVHEV